MSKVRTAEILPLDVYAERRPVIQQRVMFEKARRRLHVGDSLTFLFENAETMRYQVQEMLRIEKRTRPEDIAHEVETFNEVLGGPSELGCTLQIEIDDPAERAIKLQRWLDLPGKLYLKRADGSKVYADFDARQVGETRVSTVQYLKFAIGDTAPVAIGCEHPDIRSETQLSADQRAALAEDLAAQAG